MFQEFSRHACHAGIARRAPGFDAGADLIDQRQFDELPEVVVLIAPLPGDEIARGPPTLFPDKRLRMKIMAPMRGGLAKGGIDDEFFDAFHD
ncbi:MAG: hypothetical protein IKC51_09970 [Myxococcaceae bacterium]|nr:hypothetical protein [Myxococcaceae bacterium]